MGLTTSNELRRATSNEDGRGVGMVTLGMTSGSDFGLPLGIDKPCLKLTARLYSASVQSVSSGRGVGMVSK